MDAMWGVTLAHVAGAPVEELVAYAAMSGAGTIVAIRVWCGRWFPLRSARSARPSVVLDPDITE